MFDRTFSCTAASTPQHLVFGLFPLCGGRRQMLFPSARKSNSINSLRASLRMRVFLNGGELPAQSSCRNCCAARTVRLRSGMPFAFPSGSASPSAEAAFHAYVDGAGIRRGTKGLAAGDRVASPREADLAMFGLSAAIFTGTRADNNPPELKACGRPRISFCRRAAVGLHQRELHRKLLRQALPPLIEAWLARLALTAKLPHRKPTLPLAPGSTPARNPAVAAALL